MPPRKRLALMVITVIDFEEREVISAKRQPYMQIVAGKIRN